MITFITPPCFTNQFLIEVNGEWELNGDYNQGRIIAKLTDGTKEARFESDKIIKRDEITESQLFQFGVFCRNNFEACADSQKKTQVTI